MPLTSLKDQIGITTFGGELRSEIEDAALEPSELFAEMTGTGTASGTGRGGANCETDQCERSTAFLISCQPSIPANLDIGIFLSSFFE